MNDDYIKGLIEKGKRIDGRKLDEFRNIIIENNVSKNASGSARCKIGETEVIVGVKFDLGEPYPDSPDEGTIVVTAELIPLASPDFELGPPSAKATELARIVDRGIRESECIDFKKLCVKKGEKIWMVFIDIYPLNDDGNLIDASVLASLKALQEAKFPKLTDDKVDHESKTNIGLKLSKLPILTTVYKISGNLLVDVNNKEEQIIDARLSISVADGNIHALQKGGDTPLTIDEVKKMVDIAMKKEKELVKFLK
ncbi:exosome complex protein Rrp42 [Candidatus Woesearchaeota archaeon]|nr:exosome complex protein Rrp42 [Candidatus Woesearchaeota archaeon]